MVKSFQAVALCLALLAASAGATGGVIIRSFESPCNDRTDGIDYREGYLYHANFNGPNEILKTNLTGSVVASLSEPRYAVGVDFTGTAYWAYTYWPSVPRDRICRLTPDGSITASFAAPLYGCGVACDGEYLWYATAGNHNWNYVYELTKQGSVVSSFQAPHGSGFLNTDVDWGDSYLWLAQASSAGGVVYQMTTTGSVVYSIFLQSRQPTGVAWNGKNTWFVDGNNDWVYLMRWSGIDVAPASIGKVKALFR
jgi:hypothetical protein